MVRPSFSEVITGSRVWVDREAIWNHLDMTYANCIAAGVAYHLSVGDCPAGVDLFVLEWLQKNQVIGSFYIADWKMHGKAAGPIRNREMLVNSYPDAVSGFLQRGASNRGTQNALRTARYMKLNVKEYWSDEFRAES